MVLDIVDKNCSGSGRCFLFPKRVKFFSRQIEYYLISLILIGSSVRLFRLVCFTFALTSGALPESIGYLTKPFCFNKT